MKVTVVQINTAWSQLKGGARFCVQVVPNSRPTKCGRCHRGIIIRWPWGKEPVVTDCKVCGTQTEIDFLGRGRAI